MTHGEQTLFNGADYYNATDMMKDHCCYGDTILADSEFSEVQMNSSYNVTERTQISAPIDVFNHVHIPVSTEQSIDRLDVKSYGSSFERSGLTFYGPQESSGVWGPDNIYLSHWSPKEETVSSGTYMNMEWQDAENFPVQQVVTNNTHEYLSTMKREADTSDVSPKSLIMSSNIRERSRETEYRRRSVVSQRVQALRELLPTTSKDKRNIQESTVQGAIGYIKYLQLQLKELTRSRLGGESSSGPLKFFEGYGHFHPHGEMLDESLEEILGNLFEENTTAASELLESKGLYMLPIGSDALLCNQG